MAVRTEHLRRFPTSWIIIAIVIFAVGGLAFWFGQRDTIKLTGTDREIAKKIEAGTLTSDDLEKVAQQGIAEYNKLTGGESAQSAAPAISNIDLPPIKEKWTIRELTLIYRETKSAKGTLKVWTEGSQIYGQNLLDKPIDLTGFMKYNGEIESKSMGSLTARQKESIGSFEGITGKVELWYEIKTP